jgi:L-cysteine:1D-myo-inositol 2-amino-2-deoxy-alpha-D-glucopyranoside ligase
MMRFRTICPDSIGRPSEPQESRCRGPSRSIVTRTVAGVAGETGGYSLQLWNTATRRKDPFSAGPEARIYVCGITPYATTHLGHARTYLIFDVLIKELERKGHRVLYAQNVTDVDDPLFDKALSLGQTVQEVTAEFTGIFKRDMAVLGIRPPDFFPYASQEVEGMQRVIGDLVDKELAYTRDGITFFRSRAFPRYGQISNLDYEQMVAIARERGEDPSDPRKEYPLDFILWKPSRPGDQSWPSPWGVGRPGWHIECSAMALRYLGAELDVHGGGTDLIYPHHEHEAAQSESTTGHHPFSRFWVHVEMVLLGGIKMSKSLGNLVLVRELTPTVDPRAIRRYLLETHYRSELDYSEEELKRAAENTCSLDRALALPPTAVPEGAWRDLADAFESEMADDLNTPAALATLGCATRLVADAAAAPELGGRAMLADGQAALRAMAARLGLAPR